MESGKRRAYFVQVEKHVFVENGGIQIQQAIDHGFVVVGELGVRRSAKEQTVVASGIERESVAVVSVGV